MALTMLFTLMAPAFTFAVDSGYYLVGSFSSWGLDGAKAMSQDDPNNRAWLKDVALSQGDECKIVWVNQDGVIPNNECWYGQASDNDNYSVPATGHYRIYLNNGYRLWAERLYALSVSNDIQNGSVTLSTTDAYIMPGTEVTVTPIAGAGYAVDKVYQNGTEINPDNGVYKFTMGSADVVVSATFAEIPHTHTPAAAVEENRNEPTCTEAGSYDSVVYCSECGEEISRETIVIPATGVHTLTHYEAVASTCTIPGNIEYYQCSVCGKYFTDAAATIGAEINYEDTVIPVDLGAHTWGQVVYDNWYFDNSEGAWKCTATRSCTSCLEKGTVTVTAENTYTVEPTCGTEGYAEYTAKAFDDEVGDTYTETIPATGNHTWGDPTYVWAADYSTCTATRSCSVCTTATETEVGNVAMEETPSATCDTAGEKTYTATFNNPVFETQTKTEPIPATGHAWDLDNPVWGELVSDGNFGYQTTITFTCTTCRETTSVDAYGGLVEEMDPNCAEPSYTYTVCTATFGGQEFLKEYRWDEGPVDPTAHPFDLTHTAAKAATCTEAGNTEYWYCGVCDKYFSDEDGEHEIAENSWVIPATGHTWGDWALTTAPTVNEAGVETRECSVCHETETRPVDMLPAVAQIGNVKYETFAGAVAARQSTDDVITLLAAAGTYTMASVNEAPIKVAKNGKSVTIKAPEGPYVVTSATAEGVTTYTVVDAVIEYTKSNGDVSYLDNLPSAFSSGTYKLLADVTRGTRLPDGSFASNVTLDLNGHTYTSTATDYAIGSVRSDHTLTITDTSENKGGKIIANSADKAINISGSGNTVTIEAGVTIEGSCVAVFGSNQTLNINGTIDGGNDFAVATNGSQTSNATVNVNSGAVLTSNTVAMYLPASGTTTIAGTVTGTTAVYAKSADVVVNAGAVLTGNGAAADYTYNGNGCNPTGDALVLDNCDYPGGVGSVTVYGGTFNSTNAKGIGSYAGNSMTELASVHATSNEITIPDNEMWLENANGGYDLVEAVTVTFDADNGNEAITQKIKKGTTATAPDPAPTKDGYTFSGWFAPEAEAAFDFENTTIDADLTLTAQWTALPPIQYYNTWSVPNVYYFADEEPIPARTTQGTIPKIKREGESSYHVAEDWVVITWTATTSEATAYNGEPAAIATVDANGLVTFTAPGTVKVWLVMTDPNGAVKAASKTVKYVVAPAYIVRNGEKVAYGSLYSAFNDAQDCETVVLSADANVGNISKMTLNAEKAITVDLNGFNVTLSQNYREGAFGALFTVEKGTLNIVNSGNAGGIAVSGNNCRAFNVDGTANSAASDAVLNIGAGVSVSSAKDCCVTIFGNGTVNTAGRLSSPEDFAIAGNGSSGQGGYVINVTGGSVTGDEVAIYHPNSGELNISGGTITGKTAIYQKSGTLTISGGTITGTGAVADYSFNGNGANATGDAIVVDNCNYPGGAPTATISGTPTITSTNGKGIGSYYGNNVTELASVTATSNTISIPDDEKWVAKGTDPETYDLVKREYVAQIGDVKYETLESAITAAGSNDTITLLADVTGEFEVAAGKAVVLNLNGKTITSVGDTLTVRGTLTVYDSSKTEQTAGTGKIIGKWPVNVVGGTLVFNEGIVEAQEMAGWFSTGSTVTINGGTFSSADNTVLGTPGNEGKGGNTITVNGGTFNGNISAAGYIACGIYAANNDTWTISGGTFNINGGAGIVVRAGTVNLNGGSFTTSGNTTGKVGDAGNAVPCSAVVLDVKAGYPGAAGTDQITIGNATLTTASGVDAIAVLEDANHSYVDGSIKATSNALTVPADYKWVEGDTAGTYKLVEAVVVTFYLNGGQIVIDNETVTESFTQTVANGATAIEPNPAPTNGNQNFAGWFSDEQLSTPYNFDDSVTTAITLYAKWTTNGTCIVGKSIELNDSIRINVLQRFYHGQWQSRRPVGIRRSCHP